MRVQNLMLPVTLLALFAAGQVGATEQKKAGEISTEEHSLKTKSGEVVRYELGTLFVPENRSDPKSRLIGIGFARFLADEPIAGVPPVFRLPGGPGSSLLNRLKFLDRRELKQLLPLTVRLRRFCDVVLVDQRGFSERGELLNETMMLPTRHPDKASTADEEIAAFQTFARETVEKYADQEVDLRGYTVKECAHDVADLRNALSYDKITLCGTSFGSQWSFAVMRQHPTIVARAVLSGVEPLDHGYDMPSHVFAAVQRMWRVVDHDERFKPYLPAGGMAEAARVVIEQLEREPRQLEFDAPDTEEKKPAGVIGPKDFPWRDPARILELYHGHTDRWRIRSTGERKRPWKINLIWPLIDTSLGVTPERRHLLWTDPATRYLGRDFASFLAIADILPSPDVGDEFRTPVLSEIPVIFAQGNWDTQTPIENTFEISPFFVNSRVIIAERGGHGVLEKILSEAPKAWSGIEGFARTGEMQGLPARVTLQPSQRFSPPTFPRPKK